jgi:cellulose synthase/poly-beta-1,6-N-acetylglucosamine synthase-like glycosyltransferase
MIEILEIVVGYYMYFVTGFFVLVNLTYAILFALSFKEIMYYMRHNTFSNYRVMVQSELTPSVSVLAPAFNEEETAVETVRSLMKLNYGNFEVVVINDGSTDGTLDRLRREFHLLPSKRLYVSVLSCKDVRGIYRSTKPEYKQLIVVDKENGGKADALNAGINVSGHEYVCAIDADSLLEDDALLHVVKPFLEDDTVVAAGGIVRIANGCEVVNGRVTKVKLSNKLLPIFQVVEYFRAFLSGRMAWHGLNSLLIVSGAFGLFRKDTLVEVGGYRQSTVGEDMELVTRIHRIKREKKEPYRVVFVPDPVCWTEAPESLRILSRQRNRWHRGLLDTMLIHKKMLFNPAYGVVGMAAMPYYVFVELLGPLFEFLGYFSVAGLYAMGILDVKMAVLFFIVSLFYGVMFSVAAVLLEEISFQRYPRARDLALLLSVGVIENFGYRQLTTWWRVKSFWDYFVRDVRSWGKMERRGFAAGEKPA